MKDLCEINIHFLIDMYLVFFCLFRHTFSSTDYCQLHQLVDVNSWLGNSAHNPCGLVLAEFNEMCELLRTGCALQSCSVYVDLEANSMLSSLNEGEAEISVSSFNPVVLLMVQCFHSPSDWPLKVRGHSAASVVADVTRRRRVESAFRASLQQL